MVSINPSPALHWTLNGEPRGTGDKLIIRELSWERLDPWVCTTRKSQGQYFSEPVTISLPCEPHGPPPQTPAPLPVRGRLSWFLGATFYEQCPLRPFRAKMPSRSSIHMQSGDSNPFYT